MVTQKIGASAGRIRRRRFNCVHHEHISHATLIRWLIVGSALILTLLLAMPAFSDPDPCEIEGATATCTGDQSDGISSGDDFSTPPVSTLDVHSLDAAITTTEAGADGINFRSGSGLNVTVNSGTSEDTVVIDTSAAGNNAMGIYALSTGVSPRPVDDPFLGIPIPGTPETAGGDTTINSYSDITTMGTGAHGIYAGSSTTGYPSSVENDLEAFIALDDANNTGIGFSVSAVGASDNTDGVDSAVTGALTYYVPQLGCDPVADESCRLDETDIQAITGSGGEFTIDEQGNFSFNPGTDFADLAVGDSRISEVGYWLTGTRGTHDETGIPARLVARVTRTDTGYDITYQTTFDTGAHDYGAWVVESGADTVFPDLGDYVQGLIDSLSNGASGNSVVINHLGGDIVTDGIGAHGIFGESHGVRGGNGNNGGGFFSFGFDEPTRGGDGTDGGMVSVTVDGNITTTRDQSLGVFAYGRGGTGGNGGSGGTYYGGRRGGYGGAGGDINVYGFGTIITEGNFSSGILAFSEGGIGGHGGDGGDWEGGARGGYGGDAGDVEVIGDWDITTGGDMAHGIWAKSLGGSAGSGGSDGWLRGGPGGGGLAADGGEVIVESGGSITTGGDHSYGIHAQSIGGFGGSGGQGIGIFSSAGGDGGSAGLGGNVEVRNLQDAEIITGGLSAHGIFAQSIGGGGGSGGGSGGIFVSQGGDGGAGGHGGNVLIENWGLVETIGLNARAVFGQSVGGGGGDGGFSGALFGSGGSGSMASNSGLVDILNEGMILTHGDLADGIYAQSVGGGGGSGGAAAGIVAIGGSAGGGGNGGPMIDTDGDGIPDTVGTSVNVENAGAIMTEGSASRGIFAQSIGGGGGDGGLSVGLVSLGGDGNTAGDGGHVIVNNSGSIHTGYDTETGEILESGADFSQGIFAQSVGGGGGTGGGSIGALAALGGKGGAGGSGGNVLITNNEGGLIATSGLGSEAIFAQSIGGGGGNSGFSAGFFASIGGDAGDGSLGGKVDVDNYGTLLTSGDYSAGVFAQSVGGGGGNGAGSGGWFASLGGTGGGGGVGGTVDVLNEGLIRTGGDWSHSIFAQSVGGGGGSGGGSGGAWVAIGGAGGTGNDGGEVIITNKGDLETYGIGARGIHAQSIGGGGGSGGGAGALAVAVGGPGKGGGEGGKVTVTNDGSILTLGEMAEGVFAQSVGGGGGSGGNTGSMFVTVGGQGGAGADGGIVEVINSGMLTTKGNNSTGIFAQSVGGSGGKGGNATSVQISPVVSISFALGGTGGEGGIGGDVSVSNEITGIVETFGSNSHGVFAQSVGGGGGSGGSATSVTATMPIETPYGDLPAIQASIAIGGQGGGGGEGGEVDVDNDGQILTHEFRSYGVYAQSVGGAGGDGGNATSVTLGIDTSFTASVAVGGGGGDAGDGNLVNVDNSGLIHTQGDYSTAVFAQSVGGGGGSGGDATTIDMQFSMPPTSWDDLVPMPSGSFEVAVGGDGGAAGDGGDVIATNSGTIITEGNFATGVMAQSVGGGGGSGGDARSISIEVSGDPMDYLPLMDLTSLNAKLVFGGAGAGGGDGGLVTVTNESDVATTGAFSHGIVAQSVGGGGGNGGSAITIDISSTNVVPDIPVLSDISDLTTINMTLQGSGGAGGNGGDVELYSNGNIWTEGDFAMGIVAQSVAGGGGTAGMYNPLGSTGSAFGDFMVGLLVETEAGISFAGSVGGDGTAGDVTVEHTGVIQTQGDAAHGLFAQSVSGAGLGASEQPNIGGDISIMLDGSIFTFGEYSYGIYAQSDGGAGAGDIELTVGDGTVMGGGGSGAGVFFAGGDDNTISNNGVITSVPGVYGQSVFATYGNDYLENNGVLTGSVDLGLGENFFVNYGLVNAGMNMNVGLGNLLLNEGDFAPGGVMNVFTTNILGDFEQTDIGKLWFDLVFDFGLDEWDYLAIDGVSSLAGTLELVLQDTGSIMPGEWEAVLISSTGGISEYGLDLQAPESAVVNYSLMATNETDYSLHYNVDFAPSGLTNNQAAMGEHFNAIQLAGGSEMMKPLTASIVAQPETGSLAAAYDVLSPHVYAANQMGRLFSSLDFEQAMHSCSVRDGDLRFSSEGNCTWVRVSDREIDYAASGGGVEATDYRSIANMGVQRALSEHWHGGLAFGVEKTDFEVPRVAERDGTQLQAGGILKGRYGRNALNLSMMLGHGDYDTWRSSALSSDNQFILSERDIRTYSAHAGYGYSFEGESWYVQPSIDLGWTDVRGDSLDERSGGATALTILGTDDEFLTSRFDLRIGGEFAGANQMLYRPFILTSYTHVLSGTTSEIRARLAGAPEGVPYFMQILEVDDNYTRLSVGLDLLARENWAFSFAYDRQFADSWDAHSFFAKMMFGF